MSLDRQIDQVCTHQVVEEFLYVQGDRQTVSPFRPIGSANGVMVRLNGLTEIPSFGNQISAKVVGTREGPFNITAANRVLAIQTNNDPVQTVALPLSSQLPTNRLADFLTANFPGLTFFTERNRIGVKTALLGRDATFRIMNTSTLADTLGLTKDRVYRGKNTFPGWTLVSDPSTLSDRPRRLIIFDEPLSADSNFVEVNYTTVREECRRCGGTGVENDWRYGTDGKVTLIGDEPLLIQELLKITYTVKGSNPFHPWYGTSLIERIGSKNAANGVLQNAISSDIYTAFTRWQGIKRQQEESVGQPVSDEEFPYRLIGVRIEQSQTDPTVLFVNVDVQNRSFKPFTISRGIRLPEPVNLLSDTLNQGVLRRLQ
jgi:hypothetical protein